MRIVVEVASMVSARPGSGANPHTAVARPSAAHRVPMFCLIESPRWHANSWGYGAFLHESHDRVARADGVFGAATTQPAQAARAGNVRPTGPARFEPSPMATVARRILDFLGLESTPPPRARAQAP